MVARVKWKSLELSSPAEIENQKQYCILRNVQTFVPPPKT